MSFWKRSEAFPPVLVRLLAREPHGPPLYDAEIAHNAGSPHLNAYKVSVISHQTDWVGIDLPTMHAFLTGCRVDFCNSKQMERIDAYLASKPRPTWQYLRKSDLWISLYQPLMLRYRSSVTKGKA